MKIGIDISQCIYEATGVGQYTIQLVNKLIEIDKKNEYVLFFSHARAKFQSSKLNTKHSNVSIKSFKFPISFLEFLWNRLHIVPIEWFIGDIDVFITSDWLEPPTRSAKKITTLHDLSVLRFPETFDSKITSVHKRKLKWVQKESDVVMCDSKATKEDAISLLQIDENKLRVVYLGAD